MSVPVSGGKKCYFFGKFCVRIKWMIPYREIHKIYSYVLKTGRKVLQTVSIIYLNPELVWGVF